MAVYLLAYHGGGGEMPADEAAMQAEVARWGAWMGQLGADLKDPGNPVGRVVKLAADGSSNDLDLAGADTIGGYSLIQANSMEAALEHARQCPHMTSGGWIEICETFEIPGAEMAQPA
jgi:hypothetical protein